MKNVKLVAIGFFFGLVLYKSEAVSWYRIFEMFNFQSFHMYGIIGVAVVTGVIGIQLFKRGIIKNSKGELIEVEDKPKMPVANIVGGTLFGLGWALVGSCPGPIFILLGAGFVSVGLVLIGALLGTFLYGIIRNKLPH